ncbi:MAG: parvulin-like peptidyl-prolyl isomerase [Bacteroidetes bacterium]|nr:MAG: parvulin-like peptidyl-prolyl isomerase [Bacteroidota bacterium]
MSILERIRSRAGLLVGVIMLALLAFVLSDFIGGQFGLSGGAPDAIAEIAGHEIKPQEWQQVMAQAENDFGLRTGGREKPNEQQIDQMQQQVWQSLLDKYLLEEGQYKELGLILSDDELAEQMLGNRPNAVMKQVFGDQQSGKIAPGFGLPNGELDMNAVREYVKSLSPDKEQTKLQFYQWVMTERVVREFLIKQKYFNLIKKGFYVTSAQARMEHKADSTLYTVHYVAKKYSDIPDSTVAITDADLKAYYDSHLYKFKEKQNKRNMDYVGFDVFPSADDIADAKKQMTDLASLFEKQTTPRSDSEFVMTNSNGQYNVQKFSAGQFPLGMDSVFLKTEKGKVVGPLQLGENLQVFKVLSSGMLADSGRVRHILISYTGNGRTKEQSKKLADSLTAAIKKGTRMESLVVKFTDDPGSKPQPDAPDEKIKKGNGGDYGWIKNNGQMVPEFTNFALQRKVGETDIVETTYGYHIMQCLERSKTEKTQVEVVSVERKIEPSDKTRNEVYNKAMTFANKNKTGELFNAAAKKENINKLIATDVTEDARTIQGIQDGVKPIVRWMFEEKTAKGSVSEPYDVGNRYIVCTITAIKEKGYKPLEDVKPMIEVDVRKQKKADMFIAQFNKAKASNLDGYAANMKVNVMSANNFSFNSPNILGMGYEGEIAGKLANMKKGQLSGPFKGNLGVYMIQLDEIKEASQLKEAKPKQNMLMGMYIYRVDGDAYEILKDNADIKDNRSKFF